MTTHGRWARQENWYLDLPGSSRIRVLATVCCTTAQIHEYFGGMDKSMLTLLIMGTILDDVTECAAAQLTQIHLHNPKPSTELFYGSTFHGSW